MEMIAPVDVPYNSSQSTVSAGVYPLRVNPRDQFGPMKAKGELISFWNTP